MSNEESIDLSKHPSPRDESVDFSTPDERADERNKNHELEILKAEKGPIGRLIGSSDSSLNVAFILLAIGAVAILGTLLAEGIVPGTYQGYFDKLVTFELTIAGYVMGKKST